jgi:hypothetical protein
MNDAENDAEIPKTLVVSALNKSAVPLHVGRTARVDHSLKSS